MKTYLIALSLLFCLPAQGAKLISTAVGRVQEHVVTSREVKMSELIEKALTNGSGKGKPIKIVTDVDSSAFAKQVASVLLEWVVYLEAKYVSVAQISISERDQAEAKVREVLRQNELWKGLQVSSRELSESVERKLLAKKFLRFRSDSSVVPVTDGEALKYFEQNRNKFGDLPFENFKSSIKSYLTKQQVEKRLKDWFEVLQAKYQVRNFLSEL